MSQTGYESQKTLNPEEQNARRVVFQKVRDASDRLRPLPTVKSSVPLENNPCFVWRRAL
jgi:hypothetical protein